MALEAPGTETLTTVYRDSQAALPGAYVKSLCMPLRLPVWLLTWYFVTSSRTSNGKTSQHFIWRRKALIEERAASKL